MAERTLSGLLGQSTRNAPAASSETAATAALARTCAVRGDETLEDLGNVLVMSAEDVGRLVGSEHLDLKIQSDM